MLFINYSTNSFVSKKTLYIYLQPLCLNYIFSKIIKKTLILLTKNVFTSKKAR